MMANQGLELANFEKLVDVYVCLCSCCRVWNSSKMTNLGWELAKDDKLRLGTRQDDKLFFC